MTATEWIAYQREKLGFSEYSILKIDQSDYKSPLAGSVMSRLADLSPAERDDRQIQILVAAMRASGEPEDKQVLDSVHIAVFPTYEVEGLATRTPKGDRIILLHSGLLLTLTHLSLLELYQQKRGGQLGKQEFLAALAEIAAVWQQSEDDNVAPESPALDLRLVDEASLLFAGSMMQTALIFILGHEIGHVIAEDGPYSNTDAGANHKKELYADQWGLVFALKNVFTNIARLESDRLPACRYALLGPFLALGMIAMLSPKQSLTHPAPSTRRDQVLALLNRITELPIGQQAFTVLENLMGDTGLKQVAGMGSKLFERLQMYNQITDSL